MIRRSIAGLILGPSLLVGSLAWSGFLALRTVFDPDRSQEIAEELLDNDEVRSQLSANLGSAIEAVLPADVALPPEAVDQAARDLLADPAVEELILTAFTSSHAAFLGEGSAPQSLDLGAVTEAARDAIVAVAPALESSLPESSNLRVTLPTDRIPNAGPVRTFLQTTVPIMAGAALVGALLALLTTSDRASVLSRAGIWALGTTAFYLLLGFGLPWLLRATAPDQAEVVAALVTALLRTTLFPSIVLAVCGSGLIVVAMIWPGGSSPDARDERPAAAPAAPRQSPRAFPAEPLPQRAPPLPQRAPRPRPPAAPAPAPRPPAAPAPVERPAPLPTQASPERAAADRSVPERPPPLPTRSENPVPGLAGNLPTKEQRERQSRWLPPRWVEGQGWVMDPDDPEPPPANARWVEDLGYVVPGPPPKPDPVAEGADEEDAGAGSPDGSG